MNRDAVPTPYPELGREMVLEKVLKKSLPAGFILLLFLPSGCITKPLVDLGGAKATAIESSETERIEKRLDRIEKRLERLEKHLEGLERD